MRVAVIDIGRPLKNLGWFMTGEPPRCGVDLDDCVKEVAAALQVGPVALGFEAPLFVPARPIQTELTSARKGECGGGINRPFSAGAGAATLTTALVVVPYVLDGLRTASPGAVATIEWQPLPERPGSLLLFEAFVTNRGEGDGDRHVRDAKAAAKALTSRIKVGHPVESDIPRDSAPWLNLLGAAMLRSGWAADLMVLRRPCLVVKI